jgi:tetratricopeptide (TPR) repeat protein
VTLGRFDRSIDAYRRAGHLLAAEPVERARVLERRAYVRGECQGRQGVAMRHVRDGIALLDASGRTDAEAERVRAQLLAREAGVRWTQGRLREAVELCRAAIAEAQRIDESRTLAFAMDVLDVCLTQSGRADEATHGMRVVELYEQLGDQLRMAGALGNLGAVCYLRSKWTEAAEHYTRAAAAAARAGDDGTAATQQANLGELRLNQGRVDEAEGLLVPAVRTLAANEDVFMHAFALLQLGRARSLIGDVDDGLAMMHDAARTFTGTRVGEIEALAAIAEVALVAGRDDEAAQAVARARGLVQRGETPFVVKLGRIDASRAFTSGDPAGARARAEDVIPRARAIGAAYDLLVLLTICGSPEQERERAELTRELGVVRLVALPPRVIGT